MMPWQGGQQQQRHHHHLPPPPLHYQQQQQQSYPHQQHQQHPHHFGVNGGPQQQGINMPSAAPLQDRQPLSAIASLQRQQQQRMEGERTAAERAAFNQQTQSMAALLTSDTGESSPEDGKGDQKKDGLSEPQEEKEGGVPTTTLEDDSPGRHAAAPFPSCISMPPPFPFNGPLSPMDRSRLPPMTPSMPAFTLGAFPQTPPLYPQGFFSPGLGPFSPQMGSPYFGPGQGYHFNAGLNAAPGELGSRIAILARLR